MVKTMKSEGKKEFIIKINLIKWLILKKKIIELK